MYTTKKAIVKYSNKMVLAPIVGFFGLIIFALSYESNFGLFENLGNTIHAIAMVGLAIILYVSFRKKIKAVKGNYFEINESGFSYRTGDKEEFIKSSDLKFIKKGIEQLEVQKRNGEAISINIEDYFLEYEASHKLNQEVVELNECLNQTYT